MRLVDVASVAVWVLEEEGGGRPALSGLLLSELLRRLPVDHQWPKRLQLPLAIRFFLMFTGLRKWLLPEVGFAAYPWMAGWHSGSP